jgi:hypothetical protein
MTTLQTNVSRSAILSALRDALTDDANLKS